MMAVSDVSLSDRSKDPVHQWLYLFRFYAKQIIGHAGDHHADLFGKLVRKSTYSLLFYTFSTQSGHIVGQINFVLVRDTNNFFQQKCCWGLQYSTCITCT
jgi:hypothetical protein